MKTLEEVRMYLEQKKGQKFQVEKTLNTLIKENKKLNKELTYNQEAKEIIREVGLKSQEQLQLHISSITSLALDAVFDNPYELLVEFVKRRNKTECDLLFKKDSNIMSPMDSSGGGAIDVAAFALRIASWSMENPKSNNVIILDEPMRFLSEDKQENASLMIKEISDKLGLQFIIITHEERLTLHADRVFTVSKRKNKPSKIKVL